MVRLHLVLSLKLSYIVVDGYRKTSINILNLFQTLLHPRPIDLKTIAVKDYTAELPEREKLIRQKFIKNNQERGEWRVAEPFEYFGMPSLS
jgi:hypothetical protein